MLITTRYLDHNNESTNNKYNLFFYIPNFQKQVVRSRIGKYLNNQLNQISLLIRKLIKTYILILLFIKQYYFVETPLGLSKAMGVTFWKMVSLSIFSRKALSSTVTSSDLMASPISLIVVM